MIEWPVLPDEFEWVKNTGSLGVMFKVSIWRRGTSDRYADAGFTEEQAYKSSNLDDLIQSTIDKCYKLYLAQVTFREREKEEKRQRAMKIEAARIRIDKLLESR